MIFQGEDILDRIKSVEDGIQAIEISMASCTDKNGNYHNSYCEGKADAFDFCLQILNKFRKTLA